MAPGTRLPRAERRAQLIAAAAAAFLDHGFDGTSMADVADVAGVSRLIVYRNFESKTDLYRAVLDSVLVELGAAFDGLDLDEVRERGAAAIMLPVARRHAHAFRLLWRHAWHEPEFVPQAELFRERVQFHARGLIAQFVSDPVLLEWAGRSGGAHLVDGICHWLDVGAPERDERFAVLMEDSMRALAGVWGAATTDAGHAASR